MCTAARMSLDIHRAATRRPILLCVDFDETITLHDTTSLLFQLSSSSASTQQQLVTQYVDEVSKFIRRYETKWQQQEHSSNSSRSFDSAGLREFLEGYAAVDLRSVQRVVECRALKGIQHQDLVKAASSVQIRPNCAETLAVIGEWKIISVNWNKKLVESVMTQAGVAHEAMQITANEMKVDRQGVTTGEIDVKVQSPMDKAQWIDKVQSMYAGTQPTVVYVGDSATDLLALLAADIGIWIAADYTATSSAKLLRQLAENYGIDVHPLMNCSSVGDCVANARPVLYTVTDWAQLNMTILSSIANRNATPPHWDRWRILRSIPSRRPLLRCPTDSEQDKFGRSGAHHRTEEH